MHSIPLTISAGSVRSVVVVLSDHRHRLSDSHLLLLLLRIVSLPVVAAGDWRHNRRHRSGSVLLLLRIDGSVLLSVLSVRTLIGRRSGDRWLLLLLITRSSVLCPERTNERTNERETEVELMPVSVLPSRTKAKQRRRTYP